MTLDHVPLDPFGGRLWLRLRPLALTGFGMTFSYGLMLGMALATARILGPAAKGQLTAVTNWGLILVWLSTFGLNNAISVRVAESRGCSDGEEALRVSLRNGLVYSFVVGTAVAVISTLVLSRLLADLGDGTTYLLLSVLVGLPTGILVCILMSLQFSIDRGTRFTVAQIALPGLAALILLGRLGVSGKLTALDVTLAGLVSSVVALLVLGAGLPWRGSPFSPQILWTDLRFAGATAIGGLFTVLNLRLDILALSLFVSSVNIGWYSAANSMMAPLLIAPGALAVQLMPRVAKRRGSSGTVRLILREAALCSGFGFAVGLGLVVAAPIMVPLLLGDDYRPAVPLIQILVPGYIAKGFTGMVVAGAIGHRRPSVGLLAEGLGVALTIGLLPTAYHRYGLVGVAWVSSASFALSAVTAVVALQRLDQGRVEPASGEEQQSR